MPNELLPTLTRRPGGTCTFSVQTSVALQHCTTIIASKLGRIRRAISSSSNHRANRSSRSTLRGPTMACRLASVRRPTCVRRLSYNHTDRHLRRTDHRPHHRQHTDQAHSSIRPNFPHRGQPHGILRRRRRGRHKRHCIRHPPPKCRAIIIMIRHRILNTSTDCEKTCNPQRL